jgi:hypothetical protein
MNAWWDSLTLMERVLACIAIPSTLILVIQTIMSLIGIGGEHDMDSDHDTGTELSHDAHAEALNDGHEHSHEHDNTGLRLFTLRGLVAFLAVSGWGALAISRSGHPMLTALGLGFIMGFIAMLLVAAVLKLFVVMQSNGAIDMTNAVGLDGTVYLTIPAQGQGKVSLILQERLSEYDAVSENGETLKTGEEVTVTGLTEDNRLIVIRKAEEQ